MKYQCVICEKVHGDQEVALSCCEWSKISKHFQCKICKNKFNVDTFALACCREKKVRPYQVKGVWVKINDSRDIPKDIALFGIDCHDIFTTHNPKISEAANSKHYWIWYMIPIDLPAWVA